jgi:hypothetical protein
MAKKRKTAAMKSRKPARRSRAAASDPQATVNALAVIVFIILILLGTYFYMQNTKPKAALLDLSPAVVTMEMV